MSTPNRRVVIKAARLFDGTGSETIADAAVVIEGDRIASVGPSSAIGDAAGADVVDLGDVTLIPGLMDLHVHLMAQNQMTCSGFRAATFEMTPQQQMLHALVHAQLTMEAGFTTLRDLGWPGYTGLLVHETVALRDAIGKGLLPGPRLVVAAWATITGGHLDQAFPVATFKRAEGTTADGPWELRKRVREHIRAGVDVIKTNTSGGTSPHHSEAMTHNQMTEEELDAIVSEAHAFGKKVAVHAYTPEAQIMALKAGADTLEHCAYTSDEAIELMKAANATLVPTLAKRTDDAIAVGSDAGRAPLFSERMRELRPDMHASFRRVHAGGVRIAAGTDTTVEPYAGDNARELAEYVDNGMTPVEALQTATKNAAEALGRDSDLGTLEVGKVADIVAVRQDPTVDIQVLRDRANIRFVMKAGRIYVDKRPAHERRVIESELLRRPGASGGQW